MKTALFLWCWLVSAMAVVAAPLNVAISSYGATVNNLAEVVLAEYGDEFNFVERQELDKIKHENMLQANFGQSAAARNANMIGADLFAILEEHGEQNVKISIFETDCGFKLYQHIIPLKPETLGDQLKIALINANQKLNADKQINFISLAGIRNNLSSELRSKTRTCVDELAQRTLELNAIILEREYLIELLRERDLTGKWVQAVSATEVLHFELNPYDDAKSYVIKAYITGADEQIIFKTEVKALESGALDELFAQINKFFAEHKPQNTYDNISEAKRFASEGDAFIANGDFLSAAKRYFAAFALDKQNNSYWMKLVDYYYVDDFADIFPYWRTALEYILGQPEQLKQNAIIAKMDLLLKKIWDRRFKLSPEMPEAYWQFIAEHREQIIMLNSVGDELTGHLQRFSRTVSYLYPDKKSYLEAKTKAWNNVFIPIYHERPADIDEAAWLDLLKIKLYTALPELYQFQENMPRKELAEWTNKTSNTLLAANKPELKPLSYLLQSNALLYSADYTDEKYLQLIELYLKSAYAGNAGLPANCRYFSADKVRQYNGLSAKIEATVANYSIAAGHINTAAEKADEKATFIPEAVIFMQLSKLFGQTERIISGTYNQMSKQICWNSYDDFDIKVSVGESAENSTVISSFPRNQYDGILNDNIYKYFYVDDDYTIVTGYDEIYVDNDKTGKMLKISNLERHINAVWVTGTRIFCLSMNALSSLNSDGSERVMHFSSTQLDKALDIQKDADKTVAFFGCAGEKENEVIMLFRHGRKYIFYHYQLESGEIEPLAEFSVNSGYSNIVVRKVGNYIFAKIYKWQPYAENVYQYNTVSHELQIIKSQLE